jgi:phage gpG-like protein
VAGATREIPLDQLPGWAEAAAARVGGFDARPALDECKLLLVADTKENFRGAHGPDGSPWPPILADLRPRGGSRPLQDRGLLLGSLTAGGTGHVERTTAEELVWGTNLEYASTHQGGATIKPVKGKALAIPLTPEAYRAGSPRQFGRPLVLLWKKGSSSGVLVETRKRAEPVRQYLLVPKAVIPARPFLGWNDHLAEGCGRILAEHLERAIGG